MVKQTHKYSRRPKLRRKFTKDLVGQVDQCKVSSVCKEVRPGYIHKKRPETEVSVLSNRMTVSTGISRRGCTGFPDRFSYPVPSFPLFVKNRTRSLSWYERGSGLKSGLLILSNRPICHNRSSPVQPSCFEMSFNRWHKLTREPRLEYQGSMTRIIA